MLKLASAIFLFGFFKSNLSIKLYLNLFGSLVLQFLLFIKKVFVADTSALHVNIVGFIV